MYREIVHLKSGAMFTSEWTDGEVHDYHNCDWLAIEEGGLVSFTSGGSDFFLVRAENIDFIEVEFRGRDWDNEQVNIYVGDNDVSSDFYDSIEESE